jgi:uncharacterized membrane protein YphA (DoxX/SURF4 family)
MNKAAGSAFESWIFDSFPVTPEGLGLYRIFCALFLLFFSLPTFGEYTFLSRLPADFFSPPPGPMMIFNGFPPAYILLGIHCLLIAVLICLAIGYYTKASSIATGVLLLILKGFLYSLGKIDHDILLIVVPLVMAFSGWGRAYSLDYIFNRNSDHTANSWVITLLALIIGFMFFTAGFPKILGGWLNIHNHAAFGHYLKEYFVVERTDFLAPYGLHLNPFIWKCFDYLTVIFEIGFLAAIVHPRSTRIFISLAILFHFGIMLVLNITFWPNILAYAAFIKWDRVDEFIKLKMLQQTFSMNTKRYLPPLIVTFSMVLIFVLSHWFRSFHLLASDMRMAGIVLLCLSVPVSVFYLTGSLKRMFLSVMKGDNLF